MATYILSGIILLIIVFSVRSFIEKIKIWMLWGNYRKEYKEKEDKQKGVIRVSDIKDYIY